MGSNSSKSNKIDLKQLKKDKKRKSIQPDASVEEVKHMALALDPLFTTRYTRKHGGSLKSVEKSKKNVLALKSFNLERSIKKINVLQTRNYLKKPYMKTNISVVNYSKASSAEKNKQNKEISPGSDELGEVEDIFESYSKQPVKKLEISAQGSRIETFMLTNTKNSFNKGYNQVYLDFN